MFKKYLKAWGFKISQTQAVDRKAEPLPLVNHHQHPNNRISDIEIKCELNVEDFELSDMLLTRSRNYIRIKSMNECITHNQI